jgi:hypothetical protein
MAKRKAAKNGQTVAETTPEGVEPLVVALAGQLGTLLGRIRGTADGWLENDTVRQQVSQIRDGATQLMDQVNRAGAAAAKSAKKLMPAAKAAAKKAKKSATASKTKGRSGGAVDAPGKRHRKPPPEELFDKRLGEPMGTQMGQKNLKRRGRGDR